MLCRKSQRPSASGISPKWPLLAVALASVAIAAAAWVVRRQRAPDDALSAELSVRSGVSATVLSTSNGSNPNPGTSSNSLPPSILPAGSAVLAIPGTLSANTFGVSPELIPRFHEAILTPTISLPAQPNGEPLETLTARVDAERASCAQGSTDACLKQLNDCEAAGQTSPVSIGIGRTPAEMQLYQALSSPNGPRIRDMLAHGGVGLPPEWVRAAQSLDPGHLQQRREARAALLNKCRDEHASAILPAACEGGSVAACDRLLAAPNHQAVLPRACDVGSRNACIELSSLLGFTTLAGEAARLRALELGKCSPPGSTCSAHSRDELAETARNTLRAGINQVCVQRGARACQELVQEFDRDHGDPALLAELRGYNCDLGDTQSCSVLAMMYADGRGVPRDEQKALALNERVRADRTRALKGIDACDAGDCALLKTLMQARAPLQASQDAMEQAQLAPDLETRKCDGGDLSACAALINVFNVGRHPDPLRTAEFRRKAAALLDTQCNSGKADACDAMANILIDLEGNDRARGLGLLDRSCNAGRLGACLELAMKVDDREQKEAALRRALPLQVAQCDAGNALGCLWAANAYRTGDPQKSADLKARGEALVLGRVH